MNDILKFRLSKYDNITSDCVDKRKMAIRKAQLAIKELEGENLQISSN